MLYNLAHTSNGKIHGVPLVQMRRAREITSLHGNIWIRGEQSKKEISINILSTFRIFEMWMDTNLWTCGWFRVLCIKLFNLNTTIHFGRYTLRRTNKNHRIFNIYPEIYEIPFTVMISCSLSLSPFLVSFIPDNNQIVDKKCVVILVYLICIGYNNLTQFKPTI